MSSDPNFIQYFLNGYKQREYEIIIDANGDLDAQWEEIIPTCAYDVTYQALLKGYEREMQRLRHAAQG